MIDPKYEVLLDKKWIQRSFYIGCGVLLLVDLLYHKHVHFDHEAWFGFYPLFGFLSCVALVVAAYCLRAVVHREEDYYDR